jgi:uncharacterized protein YxjI
MLKKILLVVTCLFSVGFASPEPLPEEFYVTQRWVSLTTGFDIETPERRLGTVFRRFFSMRTSYDFYDTQENLLASARMRWLSFGAVFDVFEGPSEKPIGRVEEHIFTWFPKFTIFSPADEKLAVAEMNFWGTSYEVVDPVSNQVMAKLERAFFRLKDDWKVTIQRPDLFVQKGMDPRLFVTVMAFQTDTDHWRSHQVNVEVPNLMPSEGCEDAQLQKVLSSQLE